MVRRIKTKLVLELRAQGLTGRMIAQAQGVSRNSVAGVFAAADRAGISWDVIAGKTDAEVYALVFPGRSEHGEYVDECSASGGPAMSKVARRSSCWTASAMVYAGTRRAQGVVRSSTQIDRMNLSIKGDCVRTVQYKRNKTFVVENEGPTAPRPGFVQIEVAFVGLCGTDLHIFHGSMDGRVAHDAVIGHEMSGIISAVGEGVEHWSIGDRVTVMPLDWDGTCPACIAGNEHICQNLNFMGIDSPGALQQWWNVPARTLVRLPDTLRLDHAALVEPVAVSVHDVRRAGIVPGEKVFVIGGGPIGVLIATTAREFGAEVVVIELDATRREAIAELGIQVLDPLEVDQVAWSEEWTGGAGADVVFEVSGAAAAVLGATSLARVRGRVVIVAIHPVPRPLDLQRVFWRELTLIGARVYERRDFETAVELLDRGVVPAELLITSIVPLEAVSSAFAELDAGRAMKMLVEVAR